MATKAPSGVHPDFNGSHEADVKVALMQVPQDYQRAARPKFVDSIATDWDATLFRRPVLNPQPSGMFDVVDGQNTMMAAAKRGHTVMPVTVLGRTLTQEEAARIFLHINVRRGKPTEFDVYKAGLIAKEPGAVITDRIATRYGLTAGASAGTGDPFGIRCVGATMHAATGPNGEAVLDRAIQTLVLGFDPMIEANGRRLQSPMVRGMIDVIIRYDAAGKTFDPVTFAKGLSKASWRVNGVAKAIPVTATNINDDYVEALSHKGVKVKMRRSGRIVEPEVGFLLVTAALGAKEARNLYL